MSPRHRLAVALLWLTPALWSSNYLIARAADGVIAPHLLATLRWGLAGLLLLPFAWRGLAAAPTGWWRAEWRRLLVLGALGMWICGAIVYLGAQTTSALNIGLIYAACPVGIAIIGVRLLGERLRAAQLASMALALAGVVYVIARGDLANLLRLRFTPGDGWIVLAALSWVAYSVLLSHWRSALGGLARLVATIAGGLVLLLPLALVEAWLLPTPGLTHHGLWLGAAAALILPGIWLASRR